MQQLSLGNRQGVLRGKMVMLARGGLALFAMFSSIALAWTLMVSSTSAYATGINEYPTTQNPWGIAFDNKDGYVWVAEPACDASPVCSAPRPGLIGRYSMSKPGVGEKDYAPSKGQVNPVFLTVDRNRNLWFTDPSHNLIGELVPKGNHWSLYKVLTANAAPYDLLFDNYGNLWFTEINAGKIAYFNTTTHKFVENAIPTANSKPYGIVIDKHGMIWFAENSQHTLGSFIPTKSGILPAGSIKEHSVSVKANPHLLAVDAASNIWYSEGFSGQVGVYTPAKNTYKEYVVSSSQCPTPTRNTTPTSCTGTHISGIGVDQKGLVWFDDSLAARVGNLNPATGQVSLMQISYLGAHPHDGLGIDKNNNAWFTKLYAYRLAEVAGSMLKQR